MFGSAFFINLFVTAKVRLFRCQDKKRRSFPRQFVFRHAFFLFACAIRGLSIGRWQRPEVEVSARCRAQIKVARSRAAKKCKSLGEKLPAFARKRSTFAQNVSCFLAGGVPLCETPRSGVGKSLFSIRNSEKMKRIGTKKRSLRRPWGTRWGGSAEEERLHRQRLLLLCFHGRGRLQHLCFVAELGKAFWRLATFGHVGIEVTVTVWFATSVFMFFTPFS